MRMPCAMSVVWWKYTNDSWHSSLYFLTGKRYRDVEDIWRLEAFSTFLSNPFHLQTPPNPNLCRHSLVYSRFAMFFLWRDLNIQAMPAYPSPGQRKLGHSTQSAGPGHGGCCQRGRAKLADLVQPKWSKTMLLFRDSTQVLSPKLHLFKLFHNTWEDVICFYCFMFFCFFLK